MTERTATPSASIARPAGQAAARLPAAPRIAERSLLRNPLSVLAATLASFLVVMVLLTARVVSGSDPALRGGTVASVIVARHGHALVRTTASGRVIGPASAGAQAGAGTAVGPTSLVTRASGLLPGAGERDE